MTTSIRGTSRARRVRATAIVAIVATVGLTAGSANACDLELDLRVASDRFAAQPAPPTIATIQTLNALAQTREMLRRRLPPELAGLAAVASGALPLRLGGHGGGCGGLVADVETLLRLETAVAAARARAPSRNGLRPTRDGVLCAECDPAAPVPASGARVSP